MAPIGQRLLAAVAALSLASSVFAAPHSKIVNRGATDTIPNKYIVVMKKNANAMSAMEDLDGIERRFNTPNLKGYSGEFDEKTIQKIASSPQVAYVEQEQVYTASKMTTQKDAPWGLSRISHREGVNGSMTGEYLYDSSKAGAGVTVYVVDTGVFIQHQEFEGRAKWGFNAIDKNDTDGNGHGTHCAGTVAGKTFGVAKKANIVAVKVLDAGGSGSTSSVMGGLQWVSENVATPMLSVVSMSLGGGKSDALNEMVEGLVAKGITVSVAAGNEAVDVSNVSPGSAPNVITVGSMDRNEVKASSSNFGPGVDIFAPGREIMSAWIYDDKSNRTISGTSMACPHVSGLSAYFLSMTKDLGGAKPADVLAWLMANATPDKIKSIPEGTVNKLAYNGATNEPEPEKKCRWWQFWCWLEKLGLLPENWEDLFN